MNELEDNEFKRYLAKERRKGIAQFVFWTTLAVAMLVGALVFSYFIPHMLMR
jgi:cell division septal protein FtsQ